MNVEIFKAYDIRGLVPDEVKLLDAERIGRAFVHLLAENYGATPNTLRIACGRDMRVSSDALFQFLTQGLTDAGAHVVNLGLVSSEMVYYAVGKFSYDGGVMITASHNPKQYNGLKFCGRGAEGVSGENGVYRMRDWIMRNELPLRPGAHGEIEERDIMDVFLADVVSHVDVHECKGLRVAVDAGNGLAGLIVPKLARRIGLDVVPLYFDLDGTFPNHPADPLKEENLSDVIRVVKNDKSISFGAAFDGDGDRVFFVDETGAPISGQVMTALLAKRVLQKYPGGLVLYNVNCGWIVPETVAAAGGSSFMVPVGHAIIKKYMREKDAVFAGEHSAHYFYKDLYYADSGLLTFLYVLQMVAIRKGLRTLVAPFKKYYASSEINTRVRDVSAVIEDVQRRYCDGKVETMDGIRIDFPDWWFSLRPSNTEPLLRLNVEARTRECMEEKRDEILALFVPSAP